MIKEFEIEQDYFDTKAISNSYLKKQRLNPEDRFDSFKKSDAMLLGSVCDGKVKRRMEGGMDILYPYAVSEKFDKRTKAGKEGSAKFDALCEEKGLVAITPQMDEQSDLICDRVWEHPLAQMILNKSIPDIGVYWKDENGENCKGLYDFYMKTGNEVHIVDLKTTSAKNPQEFVKSAFNFGYDMQSAWYKRGAIANGYEFGSFTFIVVSTQAPYTPFVMMASEMMLRVGDARIKEALEVRNNFLSQPENNRHAYPESIELNPPSWVKYQYNL